MIMPNVYRRLHTPNIPAASPAFPNFCEELGTYALTIAFRRLQPRRQVLDSEA